MAGQRMDITIAANMDISQVKSAVNNIQNALKGISMPDNLSKGFTTTFSKIASEINNYERLLSKGITGKSDFSAINRSGQKILDLYQSLEFEAKKLGSTDLTVFFPKEVSNNIQAAQKAMNEYSTAVKVAEKEIKSLEKSQREQQSKANKAQNKIEVENNKEIVDSNTYKESTNAVKEAKREYNDLAVEAARAKKEVEELKTQIQSGEKGKSTNPNNYKSYREALKQQQDLERQVAEAREKLEQAQQKVQAQTTADTKDSNIKKAQEEYEAATKAAQEYGQKIDELKRKMQGEMVTNLFNDLQKNVKGIDFSQFEHSIDGAKLAIQQLEQAGATEAANQIKKLLETFEDGSGPINEFNSNLHQGGEEIDLFEEKAREVEGIKSRIAAFFGLNNAINLARRAIRDAFESIKELDAAMTQTAVVTDFSVSDMWEQLPQYTAAANELGTTTQGAYETMTLFYQQGLNTQQTFAIGTETMKMARIANLDYAEATNLMTAALRGFNMELNDTSAQRINDVYSKLAAITAADTEEIATAMTKTASIASSANMEFETTAALLSQIIETTRESPETAGTAMKTIIARFSEVKKLYSEGQLTGVDGEGEAININKIDAALKTVGISLRDFIMGNEGLDDIFMQLAQKWDTLDMATQRYIATMAAGSRQQSRFIAMMSNYDRTMELVDAANNSAGASQEQFEKTLESLESKLNALSNAWQEFTMGLANSNLVKDVVDLLTLLLNAVNAITGAFGDGGAGAAAKILLFIGALKLIKPVVTGVFNSFSQQIPILTAVKKAFDDVAASANRAAIQEREAGNSLQQTQAAQTVTQLENSTNQKSQLGFRGRMSERNLSTTKKGVIGFGIAAGLAGAASEMAKAAGSSKALSDSLQNTSTAATAAAGGLQLLSMAGVAVSGVFLAVVAALVAAVGVITYLSKTAYENSTEGKLKSLEQATKDASATAKEAKASYENLLSMSSSYSQTQKAIEHLAKGTREYEEAIVGANEEVLNLIETYPELKKYLEIDGTQFKINPTGIEELQTKLLEGTEKAQFAQLYIGTQTQRLQLEALKEESSWEKFAQDHGLEDWGAAVLGQDLSSQDKFDQALNDLTLRILDYSDYFDEQGNFIGTQEQKDQLYNDANNLDYLNGLRESWDEQAANFINKQQSSQVSLKNQYVQMGKSIAEGLTDDKDVSKLLSYRVGKDLSTNEYYNDNYKALKEKGLSSTEAYELFEQTFGVGPGDKYKNENGGYDVDSIIKQVARAQAQESAKQKGVEEKTAIEDALKNIPKDNRDHALALVNQDTSNLQVLQDAISFYNQDNNSEKVNNLGKASGYDKEVIKNFVDGATDYIEQQVSKADAIIKNSNKSPDSYNLTQKGQIASIWQQLGDELGSNATQAFMNSLEQLKDADAFDAVQQLINAINFNNPIAAAEALTEAMNSGQAGVSDFAGQMLELNQETLGAAAQFQYLLKSGNFSEIQEKIGEVVEANGDLGADDVRELAKSYKDLDKLMGNTGLTAESMARALQMVYLGQIQVEDITNAMIRSMQVIGQWDQMLSSAMDAFSGLDNEDPEQTLVNQFDKAASNAVTQIENGMYGSDSAKNTFRTIYGDSYAEAFKKNKYDDKAALDFLASRTKELFGDGTTGNAWMEFSNNRNIFGEDAGGTKNEKTGLYDYDWNDEEGHKKTFSVGQKDGDIYLEGYDQFSSEAELAAAYADKFGVSVETATTMLADFANRSPDFDKWVKGTNLVNGLTKFTEGGGLFDTGELTTQLSLLGMADDQVKTIMDIVNGNTKISDINVSDFAAQLGIGEAEAQNLLTLIKSLQGQTINVHTDTGELKSAEELIDELREKFSTDLEANITTKDGLKDLNLGDLNAQLGNINIPEDAKDRIRQSLLQGVQSVSDGDITIPVTPDMSLSDIESKLQGEKVKLQTELLPPDPPKPQEQEIKVISDVKKFITEITDAVKARSTTITVSAPGLDAIKTKLDNLPTSKTVNITPFLTKDIFEVTIKTNQTKTGAIITSSAVGGVVSFGSYAGGIRSGEFSSNYRKRPGLSLTGEEGPEIVWNKEEQYSYIVGTNGPEFANLQPGDQVFNNPQTKKILRNGLNPLGSLAKGTYGSYAKASWSSTSLKSTKSSANTNSTSTSSNLDEKAWKNSIDWFYNYIQRTNAALKIREKYERQYNLYLKKHNTTLKHLIDNFNNTKDRLNDEKEEWTTMQRQAEDRIKGLVSSTDGQKYKNYVSYQKDATGVYRTAIDWNAINKITDQKTGEAVSKYLQELEAAVGHANDSLEKLDDIESQLIELNNRGKDAYFSLEERVYDALVSDREKQIEQAEKNSSLISEMSSNILDRLEKQISETRRLRENQKAEKDIAEKQRRLAYLQQDTSTGNLLEILKLQTELEEQQQDYTDSLIDQKIDQLSEENEKAQEQRERQISILEAQLQLDQESGAIWKQVGSIMETGIKNNAFDPASQLAKVLKESENFSALSNLKKMEWLRELEDSVEQGFAWLKTGATTSMSSAVTGGMMTAGDKVELYDKNGKSLGEGTVTTGGNVNTGDKVYTGVSLNSKGQWASSDYYQTLAQAGLKAGDKITFTNKSGQKVTGVVGGNGFVFGDNGYTYNGVIKNSKGTFQVSNDGSLVASNYIGKNNEKVDTNATVYYGANHAKSASMYYIGITGRMVTKDGQAISKVYKAANGKYYSDSTALTDLKVSSLPDLKQGSKDATSIKKLQRTLNFLGYTAAINDTSGVFGPNVVAALKAFQKAVGISQTGQLDAATKKAFANKHFKTGGLADFTGPAWLDGTKSKPEIVLNQKDSQNFLILKDILSDFIKGGTTSSSQMNGDNYYEIDIHVDSISSDYDVDKMASRVKSLIVQDSMYRNVNAVNRKR